MIVIDGRESNFAVADFANLEEILEGIMKDEVMGQRIITDVFLNEEAFSELYPHQAEDIECDEIERLEIRSVSLEEMAGDVAEELPKVVKILAGGARSVAALLRKNELAEAFEMLQDMIAVSRDFLNTVHVLRGRFSSGSSADLDALADTVGDILGEITDVIAAEDWLLVADLLEYEYIPACEGWNKVLDEISSDILSSQGE